MDFSNVTKLLVTSQTISAWLLYFYILFDLMDAKEADTTIHDLANEILIHLFEYISQKSLFNVVDSFILMN
jgi:hypothetical protein